MAIAASCVFYYEVQTEPRIISRHPWNIRKMRENSNLFWFAFRGERKIMVFRATAAIMRER